MTFSFFSELYITGQIPIDAMIALVDSLHCYIYRQPEDLENVAELHQLLQSVISTCLIKIWP